MNDTLKSAISRAGLRPLALKAWPYAVRAIATVKRFHTVTRHGLHYRLDLNELIDASIYTMGEWEAETCRFLRDHIKSGDTVIEVGANIGAHTLLIASLACPGRVIAFEPTDGACSKLRTNLGLNPQLKNVEIVQALVTNGEHNVPNTLLKHSWPLSGRSSSHEATSVPSVFLDGFVNVHSLSLLKIDVDGYDFKVLEGAVQLLKRFRPAVLVELNEDSLRQVGDSAATVHSLMRSLGYSLTRMIGENAVFKAPAQQ